MTTAFVISPTRVSLGTKLSSIHQHLPTSRPIHTSRRPRFTLRADESQKKTSDSSHTSPAASLTTAPSNSTSKPTSETSRGNGGIKGTGGGAGGGGGNNGDGEGSSDAPIVAATVDSEATPWKSSFSKAAKLAGAAYSQFLTSATAILKSVPAPVLVTLISLLSTVSGAKYKAKRDKEQAKKNAAAAAKAKKDAIERELRATYEEIAAPILRSAAKLAERIHFLLESDWSKVEREEVERNVSPAYSAYLLGRYLATVEILKRQSALLDYGFPAADRVLANILGRVQGVLCANDEVLIEMQRTEHLFQPGPGQKELRGGPLHVTARSQTVLGELLFRKLYKDKYGFVDTTDAESSQRGPNAVVSFLEFSRLLKTDPTVAKWYGSVIEDFVALERRVKRIPREKRRSDAIGSRLYFVQNGLLDLVEFFDPLPQAQAVPFYRRERLRLGKLNHSEELRAPMSLHLLYNELSNMRDHRVMPGDQMERLKLPGGAVEVHVKAAPAGERSMVQTGKQGDCPFSQRVMIVLEELGIPYKTVYIPAEAKPAWYYLLHPENRTPLIYHNGNLVETSKLIVQYLIEKCPTDKKLGSADRHKIAVGTAAFTRFHDEFNRWLIKGEGQEEFEKEVRVLNRALERAQQMNQGAPFLGGEQFAREDTAIAPMLNNVAVAGRKLKNWSIPEDCGALQVYLAAARKVSSFVKTVGSEEAIVKGYEKQMESGPDRVWRMADMLE